MKPTDPSVPQGTVAASVNWWNEGIEDLIEDLQTKFGEDRIYITQKPVREIPGAPIDTYLVIAAKSAAATSGALLVKEIHQYIKENYGSVSRDDEDKGSAPDIEIHELNINIDPDNSYDEQLAQWVKIEMDHEQDNDDQGD